MSSHREAPEISKDPVADSTDLYAFVSPDAPDTVTSDRQLRAVGDSRWRAELLRVRRRRAVRDQHRQRRRRARRRYLPVRVPRPKITNRNTFLYNTGPIDSLNEPELEPPAVLHGDTRRRVRAQEGAGPRSRVPAMQRRRAVHAELRRPGPGSGALAAGWPARVRRPARRRFLRRPRLDLRPLEPASVPDRQRVRQGVFTSPATGVNALDRINVHSIAHPGADLRRTDDRQSTSRMPRTTRATIGIYTSASRRQVTDHQGPAERRHRGRPVRAGLAAGQPAVQRGHRADVR